MESGLLESLLNLSERTEEAILVGSTWDFSNLDNRGKSIKKNAK